ncbi:MFS transporter [Burkholderia multivorans]|uniref:MFS transporter n=1 Tax=Burkholderia multivorans TaxID=87883 RepID=UPI000A650093|nr:MFS transporter [Burkholderia multivorans]MBU9652501.1 MHS family MFS transporter [Burkholderia multivorans]MDN8104133.1 MFS transporter [Burkholderia multivorans]
MEKSFDGAAGLQAGDVGHTAREANLLPANEAERAALLRRAVFASLVGTAVEWYDYFIFATASTLVFGELFFPGNDPMIGAIKAFAVFGVGFLVRALGGIIFGDVGDRYGRKKALVITFMLMGLSTFLIGLLPTTHSIGLWAPILLVILRLCQGFGVGGEWGGASLVAVEYAPKGKRGMYGSVPQIGNAIGLVAATGAFALVARLPREDMMSWGWRVPFLFSIILVMVGLFIRFRLTETPAFLAAQEAAKKKRTEGMADKDVTKEKLPISMVLRHFYKPLLLAMGMRLGEAFFGYLILTIGLAYASHYTTVPTQDILWAGTIAAAGGAFTYWAFGALSDKIGRRGTFMIGAATGIVMAFPFFWILKSGNVPLVYLAYFIGYTIGVGATYAVEPSFFSELFGTKVRYTGISLAAQLPSILVGLWPMASAALLVWSGGDPWPLAAVTAGGVFVGGLCAWLAPETNRADLTQLDHDA